jgi:hypothetical protein
MIVYIESNLLLEIVLDQEQSASAKRLLDGSDAGAIDLRYPFISLYEPLSRVISLQAQRNSLSAELDRHSRQLQWSSDRLDVVSDLSRTRISLARLAKIESDSYEGVMQRVLQHGRPMAFNASVFAEAIRIQYELSLELPDAMVLGSILSDMRSLAKDTTSCFCSRDSKAFGKQEVKSVLKHHNCKYIASFAGAIEYLDSIGSLAQSTD